MWYCSSYCLSLCLLNWGIAYFEMNYIRPWLRSIVLNMRLLGVPPFPSRLSFRGLLGQLFDNIRLNILDYLSFEACHALNNQSSKDADKTHWETVEIDSLEANSCEKVSLIGNFESSIGMLALKLDYLRSKFKKRSFLKKKCLQRCQVLLSTLVIQI